MINKKVLDAKSFTQSLLRAYFGYRFNLTYQLIHMSRTLGDITILMIVGSVPDYVQGSVKLFWALTGKLRT